MNQTLADQNRACEIFVNARKDIGDDLKGFSLVDLLADNAGWPLPMCWSLAEIVVERCECSERLRIKYGKDRQKSKTPSPTESRITELAQVAYQGYGSSVDFKAYNGEPMPAWDELPDRIKRGWRGAVVELLLEYQDAGYL